MVGFPVTTAPRGHTPNTDRASWRQKLPENLYLMARKPGGEALPEWRASVGFQNPEIWPHLIK